VSQASKSDPGVPGPPPFHGPYHDGPPASALTVDAPSLRSFRLTEVRRAFTIAVIAVLTITRSALRRLWRGRGGGRWSDALANGVVDAFMALGPTFVKLGQLMASSPGMFPTPLADACLRCLDEVPPVPSHLARAIVVQDLGRPVAVLFRSFDDQPLSAASIAQVHACVLADGREAVLKIQRPAIAERMNQDLRIMHRLARLFDHLPQLHLANLPAVVEDLHQVTNEELNFALEAFRQSQFRANLSAFGDNKWITAPEIYWDWCGPRVIAMERMRGIPMDDFDALRAQGVDGELILRRGVKAWMEAALVHGPFHGDVHAGNLWVLEDGRASYLDFGIMGVLPDLYRDALRDAQYTTMIDGDYTRIVRAWQRIGILSEDLGPVEAIAAQIKLVMEPMLDLTMGEVSLGSMLQQQMEMAKELNARAAKELVLVTKQMLYFERYAKELAPDYNMSRDLFLLKNVFPEAVAEQCTARGVVLPE
jgi:predicted unusual protein kinase regulating ubiquinone biosynthesis (AarF/ABC1/UbiB family)